MEKHIICQEVTMIELPVIMASLEIDDNQVTSVKTAEESKKTNENPLSVSHRVLRKRVHGTYQSYESSKRRCSLRPTKLNISQETDDVKSYFVSKKFCSLKIKTLATIYEEPKVKKNGAVVHTGATKMRRINFSSISKDKIKKRKAKVKKVITHKSSKKGRLSMEAFLARLGGLMGSSSNGNSDKNGIMV